MDVKDFLWNMYNEHTTQARHHETQRTAVVTVVLTLAGAVIAYFASIKTSVPHWPMSAFLVILGLFGAGFSLKQTERARFHMHTAGAYRRRLESELDEKVADTPDPVASISVASIRDTAEKNHNSQWSWLTGRDDKDKRKERRAAKKKDREPLFHLYWFFIGLSALVIVLGIVTWVSPI